MKQMSEHVSANIILQMGIVGIIAHNRQFVHTANSAYHSILRRMSLLKVNILLLVRFVGIIDYNEQFVSYYRLSIP